MKNHILLAPTLVLGLTMAFADYSHGGSRQKCQPTNCCTQPACKKCGGTTACGTTSSGPTTKWFKAKDGTIREVMTHWEALHRAVDADNMEIELRATRSELEATTSELAALKETSAAQVAALEQQLAELKSQLNEKNKAVQNQKKRANTAEAARKASEQKVASLTEAGKKSEKMIAEIQKNLQQTASERDALKAANDKLQADVKTREEANAKLNETINAAQAEIAKMKQEAIESKKAAVAAEKKAEEAEANKNKEAEEQKPVEEPAAAAAPAEEPKN